MAKAEYFCYTSGDDEGFSVGKHQAFINALRLHHFCRDEGNVRIMSDSELTELNSIVGAASILISNEQERRKDGKK